MPLLLPPWPIIYSLCTATKGILGIHKSDGALAQNPTKLPVLHTESAKVFTMSYKSPYVGCPISPLTSFPTSLPLLQVAHLLAISQARLAHSHLGGYALAVPTKSRMIPSLPSFKSLLKAQ